MNTPYVFKKCTECGKWLVACKINFHQSKTCKWGLSSKCKDCRHKYNNSEKMKEVRKAYSKTEKGKEIHRIASKKYYNTEKGKENSKRSSYKYEHSEHGKETRMKYKQLPHVKKKEKERVLNYSRSEKGKETRKKYMNSERGKVVRFNESVRRNKKLENQGKGMNVEQWKEMMEFFNWECAYSGKVLSKKNRSIDHIVPIYKGGFHEIWNLVPMYINYNSSKKDNIPLIWYREQEYFSEERLAKIVEWQQYAYDKWATEEDDELILITDLK